MKQEHGLWKWFNDRLPIDGFIKASMTEYYTPKNFNFWYFFGSLALLVLVIQFLSGIFLLVHYHGTASGAFTSVQKTIMYDVKWGWLVRYIHTTGASMFFIVIYLHIARSYLYGSFRKPRELLWIIGWGIYVALMAEAYFGYVLPYGNMSFWGGAVITNIVSSIPYIGSYLGSIMRGSAGVSGATVTRFMAFHVILVPLILLVIVVFHLVALHHVGSNNPDGIEIRDNLDSQGHPLDGIPFHPYFTVKDIFGVGVLLTIFAVIIFYGPTLKGLFIELDNYIPSNPLQTPGDVTPAWYLAPYYAILRAIPSKEAGIGVMATAVLIPFFMPWLDRCSVKSIRYRPVYFGMLIVLAGSVIVLGWIGMQPASTALLPPARVVTALYFGFFFLLPFTSHFEPVRPVPERVK